MPADRPVCGLLADGTAFFAPIGEVLAEGALVTCHPCGRLFRSVTAHLPRHGWTKERYCLAFGLERGQSLEGPETRKLRAAAFTARLLFEPAVRQGSAAGRARARSGDLTRDAANALRRHGLAREAHAASRHAARRRAAAVAVRLGHPDIADYVRRRRSAGWTWAAISRESGQPQAWLRRHASWQHADGQNRS